MNRCVIVIGASIAAALTATAAASASRIQDSQTVRLIATTVEQTFVDAEPEGLSQGDQYVFHEELTRRGRHVGEDGGVCSAIASGGQYECLVTYSLSDGQVTAQGLAVPGSSQQARFTFAISGGSGAYEGVEGQVRIVQLPDDQARVVLHLLH